MTAFYTGAISMMYGFLKGVRPADSSHATYPVFDTVENSSPSQLRSFEDIKGGFLMLATQVPYLKITVDHLARVTAGMHVDPAHPR
jgi:hypothetical protein